MTLRKTIKQKLLKFPLLWVAYQTIKSNVKRIWLLRYFLRDISKTYHFMYWPIHKKSSLQLTSELLFQYHKIEKGLVMPGTKRFFGEDAVRAVLEILDIWHSRGLSREDPIYLGAIETLHAYQYQLESNHLDPDDKVLSTVGYFLQRYPIRTEKLNTPQHFVRLEEGQDIGFHHFEKIVSARRSVRSFAPEKVPMAMIERAVNLAQSSPSACNRQPCRVYLIDNETRKKELMALQNGNRGFGHLVPTLAVITSDSSVFFDASERNEPYVDGGLFSMSFMYALTSQGIASCCLNWCVSPEKDDFLRKLLPVTNSEFVIMLMAIGYPESNVMVPRSPRKSTDSVMVEVR